MSDGDGPLCFGANPRRGPEWLGADVTIADVRISTATRYLRDFEPPRRFASDAKTRALWSFGAVSEELDIADDSGNEHLAKLVGEGSRVGR